MRAERAVITRYRDVDPIPASRTRAPDVNTEGASADEGFVH